MHTQHSCYIVPTIPFSFLENNMLRSALILNERSYCNLTRNVNTLYTICEETNTTGCSTGSQLYIQWACETRQSQVFIKGVDRNFTLPKCGRHFENKIMFQRRNPLQISTTVQSDLCKTFDCDDNQCIVCLSFDLRLLNISLVTSNISSEYNYICTEAVSRREKNEQTEQYIEPLLQSLELQ
jgi:hypothetical protein